MSHKNDIQGDEFQVIEFFSANRPFGEFSNFARIPVELKGKLWPTVEHFYQAQKFTDAEDQEKVRQAKTPGVAARIGRDHSRKIRRDWESVKVKVMREAVEAKFRQHAELLELLLSTGEAKIVEHSDRDRFWGDGGDGTGQNMLGRILMDVRKMFQQNR